jgi:hypothetical protein
MTLFNWFLFLSAVITILGAMAAVAFYWDRFRAGSQ